MHKWRYIRRVKRNSPLSTHKVDKVVKINGMTIFVDYGIPTQNEKITISPHKVYVIFLTQSNAHPTSL